MITPVRDERENLGSSVPFIFPLLAGHAMFNAW